MAAKHEPHLMAEVGTGVQPSADAPIKRKHDLLDGSVTTGEHGHEVKRHRNGVARVKEEYLVTNQDGEVLPTPEGRAADDDVAEAFHHQERQPGGNNAKRREKSQGQNKARKFGSSRDEVGLCSTRVMAPEFSPEPCRFGDKCKFEHDLRRYLREHKREDLTTFGGLCPVWDVKGTCNVGWKCRFVGSHSTERVHEDGRQELVLTEDEERMRKHKTTSSDDTAAGVANAMEAQDRILLTKKKYPLPKSEVYLKWLEADFEKKGRPGQIRKDDDEARTSPADHESTTTTGQPRTDDPDAPTKPDTAAAYVDPPLLPSEKRRLYFGPETPVLAPLTTQGNLPYRRLCASLGATFTYSEMAMSVPLLQGQKSEWALIKAHESEIRPPTFSLTNRQNVVQDYDQSRDMSFGAQIAANKPWACVKATEALTTLLPRGLRLVDLNVGCPIDLVYRDGAGSALMDSPGKLEKMLRGMNCVSGDVPVTVKIRMGTKDKVPTAQKLCERLILGADNGFETPCGVAAITLHGRSRQQRYTRQADWEYIADTAALIQRLNATSDALVDTVRQPDERDLANGHKQGSHPVFFLGNGDVYSHVHYNQHLAEAHVDGVMVARGALIKPWIFEEITANQYLDKSASERLTYVEQFCRFGLEAWGSDEMGVGQTRRFLLEWLSFACRYVPLGLLEVLPPSIQDRPPRFQGRSELETLMASDNYQDWIKISEMFLGRAHKDFHFAPKHKSNSYEIQAEG